MKSRWIRDFFFGHSKHIFENLMYFYLFQLRGKKMHLKEPNAVLWVNGPFQARF